VGSHPPSAHEEPAASPASDVSPTPSPSSTGANGADDNGTGTGNQTRPFKPEPPRGECGQFGDLEPVLPTKGTVGIATGWSLLRLDLAVLADPAFAQAHPDDWKELLADLVADASAHYEAQVGLRLVPTLIDRLPDGSLEPGTGDGKQHDTARGFMHANHPNASVDFVALIVGADYEGSVAGQADCVHGAKYPDYSYVWTEYTVNRSGSHSISSSLGLSWVKDAPLKAFMHESAHLFAAQHHYSTCAEPLTDTYDRDDATAVCDVMMHDPSLAGFRIGALNRLVMRSYVEELGIGSPVEDGA